MFVQTLDIRVSNIAENDWVTEDDRAHLNYLDHRLVNVLDTLFVEYANGNESDSLLDRIERRLYVFPMLKKHDERTEMIVGDVLRKIRPLI